MRFGTNWKAVLASVCLHASMQKWWGKDEDPSSQPATAKASALSGDFPNLFFESETETYTTPRLGISHFPNKLYNKLSMGGVGLYDSMCLTNNTDGCHLM